MTRAGVTTGAVLAAILFFAFALRARSLADVRLGADERASAGTAWLLDDPESAYRLRRVELGLAASRVPASDPFLDPPSGAPIPLLPLFDATVAGLAQRFASGASGEAALGGVEESRLESFVAHLGPWLGALAAAAAFWAARASATGPGSAAAALFAAALVATSPAPIAAASAGIVDASAIAVPLLLVQMRCVARALQRDDVLGAVLDALVAGVLSGLSSATSFVGTAVFAASWVGFVLATFTGPDARRQASRRAGLLFSATSALATRLPLSDGPWEALEGTPTASFADASSTAMFIATAPFLVAYLIRRDSRPRLFQIACFCVAIVVMVFEGPRFLAGFEPAWRAWSERTTALTELSEAPSRGPLLAHAAVIVIAIWVLAPRVRDPVVASISALAAAMLAIAALEPRALAITTAASALACALAYDTLVARSATRFAAAFAGGALALGIAPSLVRVFEGTDLAKREERIEVVSGLRWMRGATAAGSGFNAPAGPSGWSVLSTPAAGHLVQYHARRPAFTSSLGAPARAAGAAKLLLEQDASRFTAGFAASGARYTIAGPRFVAELRPFAARAGLAIEGSVIERLAFADGESALGLRRVWASRRLVDETGHAGDGVARRGPALSIWALEGERPAPRPEMRAR